MSGSRTFIQLTSVALLLLWSGVMLFFYYTGRLSHYLPQDGIFQPLVLVAGIGLAVLGIFNLIMTNNAEPAAGGCSHDHGCCGHDHHKEAAADAAATEAPAPHGHGILEDSTWTGRLIALLILAAPLTWAAFQTPDRYSANALMNKGVYNANNAATTDAGKFALRNDAPPAAASTAPAPAAAKTPATPSGAADTKSYGKFTLADLEKQVPRSKEGNFILEVPEIYYTAGDAEVQSVIAGQSVETVAQVLPEKVNNAEGHRLRIFRLLVQCCAADARPYSVPVDFGKKAPEFKDMTWVKVSGKMSFRKEGNQTVPVIEGSKIEPTSPPENAMISQ